MIILIFLWQVFEDVVLFLFIFGVNGFDFGIWVLWQGFFFFVIYYFEVGCFVWMFECYGWVYELFDFLWGLWLWIFEVVGLFSGEILFGVIFEQFVWLLIVFVCQECIVDGLWLEMYQLGVLFVVLCCVQSWLEWLLIGDIDVLFSVCQEWLFLVLVGILIWQVWVFGELVCLCFVVLFVLLYLSFSFIFFEVVQCVYVFILQFEEGYFLLLLLFVCFVEEIGEIVWVIVYQNGKMFKFGEDVGDFEMEFVDLLFVVICFVNECGLSLECGFVCMMDKIEQCDKDCWMKKVDLLWDVLEIEGVEFIEVEVEVIDFEDIMFEVIVIEVFEVSEELLFIDDFVQIEEVQLDVVFDLFDVVLLEEFEVVLFVVEVLVFFFEFVLFDLFFDVIFVILVQLGDVLVMIEEFDLMEVFFEV